MTEISKSPQIMQNKLNPMKIFAGSYSNQATVCAIIGVVNSDMKFSSDYLERCLFPSNNGKPMFNQYGKYGVKLEVNGCGRLVEIDDVFPVELVGQKNKQVLGLARYDKDQNEFSLGLLEKAFMKVYGEAYGKVESNASIDIHMLTGWIPETVSFDDVSNKENLWSRLI